MLLCLESATKICSVAIADKDSIVAFREVNEGFSHAEKLTVFITEVLNEARIKLNDLDAVAVSCGPGSYTGLRIGVSVAKGLCLSLDLPLISVSTLEAMATGAQNKMVERNDFLFCPMIDARRMEVYCSLYDSKLNCLQQPSANIITEDFLSDLEYSGQIYFFGDGADKCRSVLKERFSFLSDMMPSSKYMADIAWRKFDQRSFENVASFEPFYLKEYKAGPHAG